MQRDDLLLTKFGMSPQDLAANRDGYMTKHQRRGLSYQRRLRGAMLVAIVLITLGGEVILFNVVDLRSTAALCVPMLIGCFTIVTLIITGVQYRGYAADLHKGSVEVVEGSLRKPRLQFNRAHLIQIENRYFNLRRSRYNGFETGQRYRIYYAPHSQTILSVEPIESTKTKGAS